MWSGVDSAFVSSPAEETRAFSRRRGHFPPRLLLWWARVSVAAGWWSDGEDGNADIRVVFGGVGVDIVAADVFDDDDAAVVLPSPCCYLCCCW